MLDKDKDKENRCQHCNKNPIRYKISRLCIVCYKIKSVRHKYGVKMIVVESISYNPTKHDDRPTKHLPGTKGKIKVLRDRYSRNVFLWHPLDASFDDLLE